MNLGTPSSEDGHLPETPRDTTLPGSAAPGAPPVSASPPGSTPSNSSTTPDSSEIGNIKQNLLGNTPVKNLGDRAPKNEQLHQAKQMLSPLGLIRAATKQIVGEPTPEEQARRQKDIQEGQRVMAQERQQLETFRQRQKSQRQEQHSINAELASQASALSDKPVTHVGSSRAEQTLLEKTITDGQEKQSNQQRGASTAPRSPQKGPNLGNTQPKTDMMAAMQPDSPKKKKSEPAAHELPLGE